MPVSDFICPDGARLIPLSGKKGRGRFAVVDEDKFDLLSQYTWAFTGGYAACWYPRVFLGGKRVIPKGEEIHAFNIRMHRLILSPSENDSVDHINHDKLDNRICNLRVCSNQDNQRNAVLRVDSKSGFKGVTYRENRKAEKYRAYIRVNGTQVHIGFFPTALEAALAYDKAAIEKFGSFASTNF